MNAGFKQANRLGKLTTALAQDRLVLLRFSGSDYMNDLFNYSIDALSMDQNINFDELIGTHAHVEIESFYGGQTHFDGIVSQARWAGSGENGNLYNLTLKPWFWLAGHRRNQRIFHEKTAPQILEELLGAYGSTLKNSLTESYDALEYTVQYRESDLNFAQRLMQRFGINYHFQHEAGNHTMVLTDNYDKHAKAPGNKRDYIGVKGVFQPDGEHFWEWHPENNLTTGASRTMDYNFKAPGGLMEGDQTGTAAYANNTIEAYDFPGEHLNEAEGKKVAALGLKQERIKDARHFAAGDCITIKAGMVFELGGEQVPGVKDKEYVCMAASHSYVSDSYGTGGGHGSDENPFTGQYEMISTEIPLVPTRDAAVPFVRGLQTATVVGDGEIDCDEHGRILVHFPWDLAKANSMRCRVAQNWSGGGFGGVVIPRIGMEVVVDYIEGHPDKPIVTGCVYNGKNKPVYELPTHKTRSTFRTDSHQSDGYNELRFEDKTGEEEIFIHAQKNRNELTLHNHSEHIMKNWSQTIEGKRASEILEDATQNVGGALNMYIGGAVSSNKHSIDKENGNNGEDGVGGIVSPAAVSGPGNMSVVMEDSFTKSIGKENTVSIGKNSTHTIGESSTIGIGKDSTETIGKESTLDIGKNFTTTVGKSMTMAAQDDIIASAGKNVVIEGGDQITIQSGKSKIVLKKNGDIVLEGKAVQFKASNMKLTASGPIKLKGSKIDNN